MQKLYDFERLQILESAPGFTCYYEQCAARDPYHPYYFTKTDIIIETIINLLLKKWK